METLNEKLKRIREEAKLTQEEVAVALGIPKNTYVAKEDPKKFKRDFLPLKMAAQLADLYARHGIPRDRLMGLTEGGVVAQAVASSPPQRQVVLMPVTLPSEQALTEMFATMFRLLEDLERDELPKALAELLPTSLANAEVDHPLRRPKKSARLAPSPRPPEQSN